MMNVKLALAATLLLVTTVHAESCSTRGQRLEFRQLSHQQRLGYIAAIKKLQSGSNPPYNGFTADHVAVTNYAHGRPRFLSWHRAFLRYYEKQLEAAGSPIKQPYWDWARDSESPADSIIFSNDYFGGNGAGSRSCVPTGAFTSWRPDNKAGCLSRKYDNGDSINPVWSTEAIQSLYNTNDYDTFRQRIEGPHGNIHNGVGAVFSTMEAASDPIFYLHHTFIDKLWDDWQKGGSGRRNAYSGTNDDGSRASTSDKLGYGYTVADVLDTNNLCYTYSTFNGNTEPVTTVPPSGGSSPSKNTTKNGTDVKINVPGVDVTNGTKDKDNDKDSGNIINIHPPVSVPEDWLRRNGVSVELVRFLEKLAHDVIDKFNNLPGYVSPSALVNHPDVLKKLASKGHKFYGYFGKKRVSIPYDGAADVAAKVRSTVATVCKQVYSQVDVTYPSAIKDIYSKAPPVPSYPEPKGPRPAPIVKNPPPGDYLPSNTTAGEDDYGDEDCDEDDEDDDDEGEDDYGDEAPDNSTYPAGNDTYGGEAPAGNDTYTPAPSTNVTYPTPAPAPSYGAAPSPASNTTYPAPAPYAAAPASNTTYPAPAPCANGTSPSTNTTYPAPAPYAAAPASNTTYPAPAPYAAAPASNTTYPAPATYAAPAPESDNIYGGSAPAKKSY